MEETKNFISYVALGLEFIGVAIIAINAVVAIFKYLYKWFRISDNNFYTQLRQQLSKVILLGLEVLVAADFIANVFIEPTLKRVFTLAIIVVLNHAFLSLSLQLEVEGKFPLLGIKVMIDNE